LATNLLFLPGSRRNRHDYPWLLQVLEQLGNVEALENPIQSTVHELYIRSDCRYDHFTIRNAICFGCSNLDGIISGYFNKPSLIDQLTELISESLSDYFSRTILIGHSQGAGNALCIAKKFNPLGLILLSGPSDPILADTQPWTSELSSFSSKITVFVHSDDRHLRNCLLHANQLKVSNLTIIDHDSSPDCFKLSNLFLDCRHVEFSRPHYAHTDSTEYEEFNRALITHLISRYGHE